MIFRKAGKVICSLQFDLIFFHSLTKKIPKNFLMDLIRNYT